MSGTTAAAPPSASDRNRSTAATLAQRLARWAWRRRRRIALACCAFAAACVALFAAALAWPMDRRPYLSAGPASLEVVDRDGAPLRAFLAADQQWRFPRPLSRISPLLVQATLAAEDKRFHAHGGVDLYAAARAFAQLLVHRRVVSGASTVTMQVVKMTDRTPRSFAGKASQAMGALRLEWRASKNEIMEAYLNKAPYGGNLAGCEAGARRYWGKSAADLTLSEAALLAGMPRSPTWLNPLLYPRRAKQRRNAVLVRMREAGYIDAARCAEAIASPLGVSFHAFANGAAHVAERARVEVGAAGGALRTTIDAETQKIAESSLRSGLARLRGGVDSGAVVALDVATGEVRAWVGSPDFFAAEAGEIDGARARRAPGSTLKPFIYGAAIEPGMLAPDEVLPDAPIDFGLYAPRNFDGTHQGVARASEALSRSLNVPAVVVLERGGVARSVDLLRDLGLTTLDSPAEDYGAGLAVGNCEARLDELAAAYAAIASLGAWRPARWLAERESAAPRRVLAESTCAALFEMLGAPVPGELAGRGLTSASPPTRVAWKTGTSTGHRDAWAFAFHRQTVVGVWLGNADGRSSSELVGATAALPIAVAILRAISPRSEAPTWPASDSLLERIDVCAASGLPASRWCLAKRSARLPSSSTRRLCALHGDDGDGGSAETWPASIRGWDLARPSVSRRTARSDRQFKILDPVDGSVYLLARAPNGDRIALRSTLDRDAKLRWLVDDRVVGASRPGDPALFLDLEAGEHRATCVAEDGRIATARFTVEDPAAAIDAGR